MGACLQTWASTEGLQMMKNQGRSADREQDVLSAAEVVACVEACFFCANVCTTCADACLADDAVAEMRQCIVNDLDCADICTSTARVLSRRSFGDRQLTVAMLEACRVACGRCAQECERHDMDHCRICAGTCRTCEQECATVLAALQ
jgi:hypothetical protein